MTVTGIGKVRNKRKQEEVEEVEKGPFAGVVDLEMQSEDEAEDEDQEGDDASDNDDVDEFPEIDAVSDSEEESEEEEEDTDDLDEEDTLDENSDADSDLHIFPKFSKVVSDITGQTKVVYPEIEPDYDSDSSTEDVSRL
jgi:ribosome biogenesis protein ERB1